MLALENVGFEEADQALVIRFVRERDGEAFSILMSRYADMVYSTCRRILGDEAQAADAAQETFFQLSQDADDITGSLGGWLHRVATRRAVDLIRQDASRRRREQSYVAQAACAPDTWAGLEPVVDEALEKLPDNLRELLLLHFLQGRTTTQIAAERAVSQPTVSRRINEALELLRGFLRERGIHAGLAPLQAVLLQAHHVMPEALRYGLGKIALAKAVLSGTGWGAAASASAPAAVGAGKIALAGAALALAAGTTWVVHHELGARPTPSRLPSVPTAAVTTSAGPALPQPGSRSPSAPSYSVSAPEPQQPLADAGFSAWDPGPRGLALPAGRARLPRPPVGGAARPARANDKADTIPATENPESKKPAPASPAASTAGGIPPASPVFEVMLGEAERKAELERLLRPLKPLVSKREAGVPNLGLGPEPLWLQAVTAQAAGLETEAAERLTADDRGGREPARGTSIPGPIVIPPSLRSRPGPAPVSPRAPAQPPNR